MLDKAQSTTSHHLNLLKNAGLIKRHKEGIWTRYRLKNPEIMSLVDKLSEAIQVDKEME